MEKTRKVSLVERIGRKLPEISILFLILTFITMVFSAVLAGVHEFAHVEDVTVQSVLTAEGYLYVLDNMIANFIGFAPLGIVLGIVIGVGVAEKTGMLGVVLKQIGLKAPEWALAPIVIFLGVISSIASDAGYIVLIPLAGALYASIGRNPLIGIAAAFAGVSAGFGASLLPTPGDGLLGAITEATAMDYSIPFEQNPVLMNYFFMIGSTFLLTFVGALINKRFIEPKFKNRDFIVPKEIEEGNHDQMTATEKKGLKAAKKALLILIAIIAVIYAWETFIVGGFFVDQATGAIVTGDSFNGMATVDAVTEGLLKQRKPLIDNIVVVMLFVFLVPGYAYGKATGQIKNSEDYIKITTSAMADMAYILVLAFFAGNFVAIFSWTSMGNLIASGGADFLIGSGLNAYPILLLIGFIFVSALINLFIGSASAKWTILAPIFIPMLYGANEVLTPDVVQVAYRVADSSTNIISPLMTYTGIVILYGKRYVKDFNYGTLMDMMYPYSFGFLIVWTLFLVIWLVAGVPLGL